MEQYQAEEMFTYENFQEILFTMKKYKMMFESQETI